MANKSFTLKVGEVISIPHSGGDLFIKLLDIQSITRVTVHVEYVTGDNVKHGNYRANLDTEEEGPYTLRCLGFTPDPVLILNAVGPTSADLELTWN